VGQRVLCQPGFHGCVVAVAQPAGAIFLVVGAGIAGGFLSVSLPHEHDRVLSLSLGGDGDRPLPVIHRRYRWMLPLSFL